SIRIAQRVEPPLDLLLGTLFPGASFRLALSSGAIGPDSRRKPTAAVLASSGRPLAFSKLAGSPVARALLEHEAPVLPPLEALPHDGAPLAPRLLHAGEVDGTYVLVQSPLAGRPAGSSLTPAHHEFFGRLRAPRRMSAASTHLVVSL